MDIMAFVNKRAASKFGVAKNNIIDSVKQKQCTRRTHEDYDALISYGLNVVDSVRVLDWKEDISLNGTMIHIRPIRREDDSALRDFFETLSQESIFFRFGQLRFNMLHDNLAQLCRVDYDQNLAFVAVFRGQKGEDIIIGEIQLNRLSDHKNAEISLIVDDQWQGKGLGNFLMVFCLKVAGAIGLEKLLMLITKNNVRMQRFGFKYNFRKLPCNQENDMEEWQLKIDRAAGVSLWDPQVSAFS